MTVGCNHFKEARGRSPTRPDLKGRVQGVRQEESDEWAHKQGITRAAAALSRQILVPKGTSPPRGRADLSANGLYKAFLAAGSGERPRLALTCAARRFMLSGRAFRGQPSGVMRCKRRRAPPPPPAAAAAAPGQRASTPPHSSALAPRPNPPARRRGGCHPAGRHRPPVQHASLLPDRAAHPQPPRRPGVAGKVPA